MATSIFVPPLLFSLSLSLFIFTAPIQCQSPNADKLLLVQAVWRHGDRSPTDTFPTDPNQEDKWPQGWGQLTPLGMAQHVVLGDKLAQKYIHQLGLVSPTYKSQEIYVRSTDVNRTLTSAISNLIGFYHRGMEGKDFPAQPHPAPWWPTGFTPVAIHTLPATEDHILPDIEDVPCPRQAKLLEMVEKTPEYQRMMAEKKWFFDLLTELSGMRVNFYNFWMVADTLLIEDLYEKEYGLDMPAWTKNNTIRQEITAVDNLFQQWTNGKGLQPQNGVNFEEELGRIRGGPILWIMIRNMQAKIGCRRAAGQRDSPSSMMTSPMMAAMKSPIGSPLCNWISRKNYFAYSAHDTTISSLFAALGFEKTNFDTDGLPHYSACVTLELWKNGSSNQNEHYVKAFYWLPDLDGHKGNVEEITRNITGCALGCSLNQFVDRSRPFEPIPSPDVYCQNTTFPPSPHPSPFSSALSFYSSQISSSHFLFNLFFILSTFIAFSAGYY